jgi:hypothetical protein
MPFPDFGAEKLAAYELYNMGAFLLFFVSLFESISPYILASRNMGAGAEVFYVHLNIKKKVHVFEDLA